jgi:hypothetical protein
MRISFKTFLAKVEGLLLPDRASVPGAVSVEGPDRA